MDYANEIAVQIEVVNKHLLYKYGTGYLIVDSGSPMTFCSTGKVEMAGIEYKCPTQIPLVDLSMVSSKVGKQIIGIIGTDFLNLFDCVVFFVRGNNPIMGINYHHHKGTLQSVNILGIGTATLEVDRELHRMFVDTGAPISYIASQYSIGKIAIGSRNDFHPSYGDFSTNIYEFNLSGQDTIQMGVLPKSLETKLAILGIDGIIGIDFFMKKPLIWEKGLWYIQCGI